MHDVSDVESEPAYRRRQVAWIVLVPLMLGAGIGFTATLTAGPGWIAAPVGLFFGGIAFLFHALTVEVTLDHVRCWFGNGIIRKEIPVERITGVRAVRTTVLDGWGIRLTSRGWMWNANGFDAVELELDGGKKRFSIGTDQPGEVIAAIEAVMGPSGAGVDAEIDGGAS